MPKIIFGLFLAAILSVSANPWPGAGFAYGDAAKFFEVNGVNVDVTAKSASQARDIAHDEGITRSFRALMERLTLNAYHDRLPNLERRQILELIQDFEVAEEKTSSVRYIASLNYRYRAQSIRDLLDGSKIPFAETYSKPVVVLPVYQAAGALLLWDDPNPWRAAWEQRPGEVRGLVPTILPKGDLADMRTIGAEQAIEGDVQRLAEVASKYNAGDVVVVHGILRMDSYIGLPELEVYMTRFGFALQEHTVVKSFSSNPGEDLESLLARAAIQLTVQIEDNWKQDNLIKFAEPAILRITIPVSGLDDWIKVRDRLNGVAIIKKSEVTLISRRAVNVNINYIGDAEQLALSLDQADLVLWDEAGNWYMGMRKDSR
ncbi:MAG: DUF2066 domain-containing protein [Rhodospirillaceae bacterium]|nr:DUF2066 domain-containing protein [Rhodospirillaceae bacterium]